MDPATGVCLGQTIEPNTGWKGCEEGQGVSYLADICSGVSRPAGTPLYIFHYFSYWYYYFFLLLIFH